MVAWFAGGSITSSEETRAGLHEMGEMAAEIVAALSVNWTTVTALLGLSVALATAWATVRRLPGQQRLDEAQRESLLVDTATKVTKDLRIDLEDCRKLRVDLEQQLHEKDWELESLRRWCGRLQAALIAADIPIPPKED